MNRLLKNKKGVTILEGLIALGLLALVAGGTFGVLLSVSRKSSQPDIREEMLLAVERAHEQLQMYTSGDTTNLPLEYQNGLCNNGDTSLSSGKHDIKCMLPAICDPNNESKFSYTVVYKTLTPADFPTANTYRTTGFNNVQTREVTFDITCNGFTL